MSKLNRTRTAVARAIVIAGLLLGPAALAQEAPRLEVPVPGIELTPLIRDDSSITVPWLAQYIAGAYTFLISIAGLLASVMMIVGGFQYVTSAGDKGKLGAAKTRIVNALIGLVLAFGSYAILYAINPGLVAFNGLKISFVKTDAMLDSLMESTAATGPQGSTPGQAPPPSSTGAPSTPDGPYTGTIYKTCPLTLADTSMNGIPEFMNQIRAGMGTIVDAKTPMDKAVQIGNIAAACKMHLGNCGKSVGTFFALAGVLNKPTCNQNSTNNKDCNSWPDVTVHSVPDTRFVWWARCDNEQAISIKDEAACASPGPWKRVPGGSPCNGECMCTRSDCVSGNFAATAKVGKDLLEYAKTQPKMAGWPDSWVKDLKRGDWVIMYNGNDDKTGGHSAMFVAWADKDHMISLNGDARNGVRYGTQCITSGCINKPLGWGMWNPVTRILRQSVR